MCSDYTLSFFVIIINNSGPKNKYSFGLYQFGLSAVESTFTDRKCSDEFGAQGNTKRHFIDGTSFVLKVL